MSFTEDYRKAVKALHDLNEAGRKLTFDRRHEIAAHSIREQLEMHKAALEKEFGKSIPDQSDMDFALCNDKGWEHEQ